MKITILGALIFLVILVTAPLDGRSDYVTPPPSSRMEKDAGHTSSNSDKDTNLSRMHFEMEKIVSKIQDEENRHRKNLETIKNELREMDASLKDLNPEEFAGSEKKPWMPWKIAWFLDAEQNGGE